MDRETKVGAAEGGLFEERSDLKDEAAKAGDEVTDKARELGHQVEDAARSKAEEGRHRVAEEVHRVGEALRTGARELRDGEDDRTTDFIERLAEPVERFSSYLERHDTRQLASELEDFARRNQTVFLGGAFALGMLGARFLKASSQARGAGSDMDRDSGYDRQRGHALTQPAPRSGADPLYGAGSQRSPRPPEPRFDTPR